MTKRRAIAAAAILAVTCSLSAAEEDPLRQLLEKPVSAAQCDRVMSSTAAKYDQAQTNTPASVTVITSEEIERYGWTTLDQALQSVRGFFLTYDRQYVTAGVRGIGRPTDYNMRILLLLDGHMVNDPVIGGAPLGSDMALDLASVDRIEIVRGPGSALYGSHAMNAVINVITVPAATLEGFSLAATAGSRGREGAALRFGQTYASGLQLTAFGQWQSTDGASLYYRDYDAPETNHGVAHNLDYEELYNATFGLRKGNFSLGATRRWRTKGNPTGSYESLFNRDSRETNWADLISADYMLQLSPNKKLELAGQWSRDGEHGFWPYDVGKGVDDTISTRWGADAHFHWDLRANSRLTLGAEYTKVPRAQYRYDVADYHTIFVHPYDMSSWYVEYEVHPRPKWGVVLGLRRDDFSATSDADNPRAAVLYTPNEKTTLKLLYGTAFRSPNVYEAFYADPVTPWKANPDLHSEQTRSLELEWDQRLNDRLFLTASAFRIRASGLIQQSADPVDGVEWYVNTGKVKSAGAEAKLDYRRDGGLWGSLSYSFARAEDSGQPMDNAPRHTVKAGLSTSPWAAVHVGGELVYESGRLTRDGDKTGGFLLFNGTASKQLGERFRLGLTARNLLNTGYATPVGPELRQQSIRQDGRTLALELTYSR